jgi:hypothetical protein
MLLALHLHVFYGSEFSNFWFMVQTALTDWFVVHTALIDWFMVHTALTDWFCVTKV